MIRVCRLITIVLVGLSMGIAFCHLLQMASRMHYDVWLWKSTKNVFKPFGASLGIIIEAGATLFCGGLLILLRKREAFRWTLLCTVCMLIAHSAWWILIYPVNQETIEWTKFSIPSNWFLYRALWEFTHAARAIFEVAGFILLIISVLIETPKDDISTKSQFTAVSAESNKFIKFGSFLFTLFNSLLGFWVVAPSTSFAATRARVDYRMCTAFSVCVPAQSAEPFFWYRELRESRQRNQDNLAFI